MLRRLFWLKRLGAISLIALVFLTSACGKIEVQKEDELPEGMLKEAPPDLAKRPDGLACDFLDYIKAGKYSKAYDFLGAEAQGEISREAFVNGLTKYMAAASTKNSYMVREVSSERVVGKTGVVKVTDRNSPKSKPWTWEFEENYAGWKIRSLDLPPLMRYKERFSY